MKKIQDIIDQSKIDGNVHIAVLMVIDGVTYSFGQSCGKSQFLDIAEASINADEKKLNEVFFTLLKPLALTYINHLNGGENGEK